MSRRPGSRTFFFGRLLARGTGRFGLLHFGGGSHRGQVDLLGTRDNSHQVPTLELRARGRFDDFNGVAFVRFVVFVVYVADRAAAHEFAVPRVLHQALDLDATRLVHLVARDHTDDLSFGHY